MLYKNALIIARHYHDLFDDTVKHGPDLRILAERDVDTVVRRQLEILVDRVIMFSETVYYRTVCRPWKLSLVLRELLVKLGVDDGLV
jgi:hypothetical protein